MAIDTAAKQMSMLNFGDGNNLMVLPIPDGAYGAADWQHLLDLYSGILALDYMPIRMPESGPMVQPTEVVSY